MNPTELKPGISGYIPVRDALRLDYCVSLAIQSLLPVCSEVIACDSDSSDGTREMLDEWATREPKLRVINWPWPNPNGFGRLLYTWLNFTREHCRYKYQITLDADEVLCPKSYDQVRSLAAKNAPAWFSRLNFWGDPYHIAPHNTVCAQIVVRSGPTEWEMVSDDFYRPEPPIKLHALRNPALRIFHLGFLRKEEAFYAKSQIVQQAILGQVDPVFDRAKAQGVPWHTLAPFKQPLLNYSGDYPPGVVEWMRERNYSV